MLAIAYLLAGAAALVAGAAVLWGLGWALLAAGALLLTLGVLEARGAAAQVAPPGAASGEPKA